MAEPASSSVPRHAVGSHSVHAVGNRPVEPVRAVELSDSDLESVEQDPAPSSSKESAGSKAPTTGGQTHERFVPVAATHRRSRSLMLAAIIATLCAAVTVAAFAFSRHTGHPSDRAQRGPDAKSSPTATSVPARSAAHPALKKRSTGNAQLASVRSIHPQPGQKPSSRSGGTSGAAKGKTKQSGAAAQAKTKPNSPVAKGKSKPNSSH